MIAHGVADGSPHAVRLAPRDEHGVPPPTGTPAVLEVLLPSLCGGCGGRDVTGRGRTVAVDGPADRLDPGP